MNKVIKSVKENIDILITLVIATAIRFKFIIVDEFWFDEAYTGILMRLPLKEFWVMVQEDVHPPLYYLVAKLWTNLLGISDLTLRSLSVIFGVLTIYIAYLFAKKVFNKEVALIAAILLSISPFLVGYSIEARQYSLFGLLVALTAYFVANKKFVFAALSTLGLLLTHFISVLFIPPIIILFLRNTYKEKTNLKGNLLIILIIMVVSTWTANYAKNRNVEGINAEWIRAPSLTNIPRSLTSYVFGVKTRFPGSDAINDLNLPLNEKKLGNIISTIYFAGILVILYKAKVHKIGEIDESTKNFIIIILFVLIPQMSMILLGIFTEYSLYVERYLLPASIFFFISVAYLINKLSGFEITVLALLFYAFVLTRIQLPNYYTGHKELSNKYRDYEMEIIFTSPMDYVIGRYYLETGGDMHNIKLYNLQDPYNTYLHWPHVRENTRPENPGNAVFVSPDENRLDERFIQIEEYEDFKVYKFLPLSSSDKNL